MTKLPVFETERLILRDLTEADAPSYEKNFARYEIISQLTKTVPWPYPKGGVLERLRSHIIPHQGNGKWVWAIVLKEAREEVIGSIDLRREGTPDNRGFWLAREHWGKGYMTEAIEPIMDYAFDELAFERLTFANARSNLKSRRVKEKTGSTLLRVEPTNYHSGDTEREVWELTQEQWRLFKARQPNPLHYQTHPPRPQS